MRQENDELKNDRNSFGMNSYSHYFTGTSDDSKASKEENNRHRYFERPGQGRQE